MILRDSDHVGRVLAAKVSGNSPVPESLHSTFEIGVLMTLPRLTPESQSVKSAGFRINGQVPFAVRMFGK